MKSVIKNDNRVLYMILRTENNHPRATIGLAPVADGTNSFRYTFSFCNPVESFRKKDARARTFGRLSSTSWCSLATKETLDGLVQDEKTNGKVLKLMLDHWIADCKKSVHHSVYKILKSNTDRFRLTYNSFIEDITGQREAKRAERIAAAKSKSAQKRVKALKS